MMVKCWLSKSGFQTEANLGVIKYQGKSYHVALVRVQYMETFRMLVNILITQHFDIHLYQRVGMR